MPMRYCIIVQLIANKEGLTPTRMYELLLPIYGQEKQCSLEEMDRQLMSLKTVGLVEVVKTAEKEDGSIESTYRITRYGEERAKKYIGKYIPSNIAAS